MLLTPHVLAGMTLGSFVPPVFAPFVGILSYFILEMIPHWDPITKNKRNMIIRAVDIVFAVLSFFSVIILKNAETKYILGGTFSAFTYIFFYIIDIENLKSNKLKKLNYFKNRLKYTDKTPWGILIQVSVCIIALALMFNLVDFPTVDRIRDNFINNISHI